MENTLALVQQVRVLLDSHGVTTWLFGGWAEELHGLTSPRPHHDIDLLYAAADFTAVDHFLSTQVVEEIQAKHFPHKRAFEINTVMVELILIQEGPTTHFWGDSPYHWPSDLLADRNEGLRLASPTGLAQYRRVRPPTPPR